ncbi:hypothetical protein [Actinoplanes auranticolor]|uniref:Uncharacterized protein n=1 Tax=Actinoplanes auranticolor TaxID=47988 RepID=A0A919VRW1_9ACTN|nr:hypothetical protein [Actinoplanes auranticolor]GIM76494.1 hypothetical protein Aau02nite_71140 [Actinoplanes auranticolor]
MVIAVAVLIASLVVDGNGDNDSGGDYFRADRAWFYVVLLTIRYLVSRGWESPAAASTPTPDSTDDRRRPYAGRRRSLFPRLRRTFPWMSQPFPVPYDPPSW